MQTTYHDVSRKLDRTFANRAASFNARVIAIVVFDGFSILPAAEIVDVFDKANQVLAVRHGDAPSYRTIFVSIHGGCVSSSAQIDVLTQTADQLRSPRATFVAGGERLTGFESDVPFSEWRRAKTSHAEEIFAIANGEDALFALGTSSRRLSQRMQTSVTGELRLVGAMGNSAAGQTARSAVRHALELIWQDFGVSVLRRVLDLLPDTRWPDFEAIASDSAKSIKEKIHESAQWITRNCSKAISITVAAQTAGMSDRSYLRHFRAEMGIRPSEHLRRSRVELATALLESSDLPVDKIARRCGLTSGECLARLFRQVLHISPTEYRSRFQSGRA
ncbi:helix-turn-helix domain-containing protein [Paraburkholderia diazotrophica]|uniref:Transcriptional regulator GlxA family, contains an amidase domain and an AraC-type DNA-binding HTH domain n=1 Tax=Paraburkholderia diazotrophica TaxID=667676 RepID=A0A1H7EDX5_9BURK|nr:helix-turn-helix domain-containing protein [Paraburkholderia diazotrophica]SEK12048.1 Transcriptional regulator GlxA family, contains an amidase domain and an AraC-type DNA-binding HTH domain [Paraburkholderia diazotrophica]